MISVRECHGVEPVFIQRARRFIHDNCDGPLSLQAVAHQAGINRNYLSEQFRHITGFRFVEYVARVRVENACELLRGNNVRVSEIGFAVGFQSLSQFNRTFKRFMLQSPREFRRTCDCQQFALAELAR